MMGTPRAAMLGGASLFIHATTFLTTSVEFDFDRVNAALAGLEARCRGFIAGPGAGAAESGVELSVEARDHQLLVAAESLPIHVLSGPDLMTRAMAEFHPEVRRGDAFLHNSPCHGNSHAADHTILVLVVDGEGAHRFTVLAKGRQADCGNAIPTTYLGTARDVYAEGALIFPGVKVQEDYRDREDIVRMCQLRIRVPEQWWGDYLAMVGAGRFRGAPGSYVEYGPVGGPIEIVYAVDGKLHPAAGARGGLSGAPVGQFKRDASGTLHELPPFGQVVLEPGETVVSMACGGGGYGPPCERDPARVRHDVAEGWITRERARNVYGVTGDE